MFEPSKCVFLLTLRIIIVKCEVKSDMEGKIVGGEYSRITDFPHSVFLNADCRSSYICGSSVLNQRILLTAAHCVDGCRVGKNNRHYIEAYAGHEDLTMVKSTRSIIDYIMHANYNRDTVENDVAVAILDQAVQLSSRIKRVSISRFWPGDRNAYVAGWGSIDDTTQETTVKLKSVYQKIRSRQTCYLIGHLGPGMLCAGSVDSLDPHASAGDSGSALVTRDAQEVGLVSFRINSYRALMVYTNVTYYYNWIKDNAEILYCRNRSNKA